MARQALTFRTDADVVAALNDLSEVVNRPVNKLINDAVRAYLDRQVPSVVEGLEAQLERMRRYRESDPDFERAIEAFVQAEVANPDPLEGEPFDSRTGPVSREIRGLLGG